MGVTKTCDDNLVYAYKACLLAKSCTQEYVIDYKETFIPMAHITLIRSLIIIETIKKVALFYMNVMNHFLIGDLFFLRS